MSGTDLKTLLVDTARAYSADRAERLGAALAYYATFSLAPLVVLALVVVSAAYGRQAAAAQEEFLEQMRAVLGPDGAALVQGLLDATAAAPTAGTWATLLGGFALVFGATALFVRLQDALNTIWNATPPHTGVVGFLRSRALSFVLVVGVGALVVMSLLASALLVGLGDRLPGSGLWRVVEPLASLAVLTLLFATLYRVLPDAPVRWTDVWIGAAGAAVLFTVGTAAVGWDLGRASVTSAYGAAGALVALLLWIYYAAQIFFLGAECTKVYARQRRSASAPSPAESVPAASSPSAPSPWPRRLGWMALGVLLVRLFRR